MGGAILAMNAGSSSLKFGVFLPGRASDGLLRVMRGSLASADGGSPILHVFDETGNPLAEEHWQASDIHASGHHLVRWIEAHLGTRQIAAVGHRVVHGGREFSEPVIVDRTVLAKLASLIPLAPLHQPASLAPIGSLAANRPELLQVACFDTAFHHGLKPPVSRYPLPRKLEEEGIRRYGFHGLSYEAIAMKLAARGDEALRQRIIVAHLGNGASLCAMKNLRSADTTMGFTALDGLMMGTRPGALDPGIIAYLQRERGYDVAALERLFYEESGLAGVSELSSDVAVLLASDRHEAREALDLFAFLAARNICALAATIKGLDRLVFTAGIGENAWPVRAMIVERLGWLGAELDAGANRANADTISPPSSAIELNVMATDEELIIARHTAAALALASRLRTSPT